MRNMSWYSIFFILMFGWSIAGAISYFLVNQLGFPFTWATPLTLALLGAVLFLVYRGYLVQGWILAACIGFIIIAVTALARGFTVQQPNIPEAYLAEFENAGDTPSLMGMEMPLYYENIDNVIEYDADRTSYLVYPAFETRTPITIEFAPLESAGGQWAFVSGNARTRGANFEADPGANWLSAEEVEFDTTLPVERVTPTLVVAVPLPASASREPMNVTAEMQILYAAGEVEETTLTRIFTLTTIDTMGTETVSYADQYSNWQRSRSIVETPLWIALVVGSVLAGAGSVYLVREGTALRAGGMGGLNVVFRRLSGSQKIGAEFYALERVQDIATADAGVYVGRVIAQSPAGRAGLRTGDILLELDGKPTNSPAAVNRIGKGRKQGEIVTAKVLRHGQEIDIPVKF